MGCADDRPPRLDGSGKTFGPCGVKPERQQLFRFTNANRFQHCNSSSPEVHRARTSQHTHLPGLVSLLPKYLNVEPFIRAPVRASRHGSAFATCTRAWGMAHTRPIGRSMPGRSPHRETLNSPPVGPNVVSAPSKWLPSRCERSNVRFPPGS